MTKPFIKTFLPGDPELAKIAPKADLPRPVTTVVMDREDFLADLEALSLPPSHRAAAVTAGMLHLLWGSRTDALYAKYEIPHDHMLGLMLRSSQHEAVTLTPRDVDAPLPDALALLQRIYEELPPHVRAYVDQFADRLASPYRSKEDPTPEIREWSNGLPGVTQVGKRNAIWHRYVRDMVASAETFITVNRGLPEYDSQAAAYFRRLLGSGARIWLDHAAEGFRRMYEEE